MALPALLSGLGRQLAVQGAKGAAKGTAKKMLSGRKQEKNSNAIVKRQEGDSVGYKKLVPAIKPINFGAPPSSPEVSSSTKGDDGSLLSIKEKVIKIENLLGEQYKNRKKQAEKQRKLSERAKRKEKEEILEKTNEEKKNKGKFNIPIPGKGLFDNLLSRIFNFLFWITIGKILPTILKFLPQIIGFVKVIGKIMDVIINVVGFILDGFITFVDFGFKVYDKIRGFAGAIGGEGLVKVLDGFTSAVETLLNILFIISMANAVGGGFGGGKNRGGGRGGQKPRTRPGQGFRPKVTTTGGGTAGRPDIRNPLRERPKVTTTGGRPDIRNPIRERPKVTTTGGILRRGGGRALTRGAAMVGGKAAAKGVAKGLGKMGLKKIPGVGAVAGAAFAAERAMKGDWLGAGGELLSGLAGTIPGIGTGVSSSIDAGLMARDAGRPDIRNPIRERPRVTGSGGGTAGRPDIINPFRTRPTVTTGLGKAAAGEAAEQITKKTALLAVGKFIRPFIKRIPIFGALIDFVINVALGESVGRAASRAVGSGIGAALGAKVGGLLAAAAGSVVPFLGTAIGGVVGLTIGGVLGGMLGDWIGGFIYDKISGSGSSSSPQEKPKVEAKSNGGMVLKYEEGGEVGDEEESKTEKFKLKKIPISDLSDSDIDINKLTKIYKPEGILKITELANDLKSVPIVGGAMYAALSLALGNDVDKNVTKSIAYDLVSFSNLDSFENISSSISGLETIIAMNTGGEISKIVSESSSDTEQSATSLSIFLDRKINSQEIKKVTDSDAKTAKQKPWWDLFGITEEPKEGSTSGQGTPGASRDSATGESVPGSTATGGGVVGGPGTPEQKALLDAISFAEGTSKSYGTIFGGKVVPELEKGQLTIDQVHAMMMTGKLNGRDVGYKTGGKWSSAATGRYQFMPDTLRDIQRSMRLSGDTLFTPEMQDKMIIDRITNFRNVSLNELKTEGLSTKVLDKLAREFASLPSSQKGGKSYYGQPVKTPESIRNAYNDALGRRKEEEKSSQTKPGSQQQPPGQTPSPTSGPNSSSNNMGNGSKLAGELGRFIKTKLESPKHFSKVWRHPEHPPYSLTSGHSQGSLHYQGRAVDIGAYDYEQGPILDVVRQFNSKKGINATELIHAGNDPRGDHDDHVHVAYEGGGLIRPKGSMSVPNSFASYNSPKSNTKVVMVPVPVPVSKPQMSPVLENSMGGFVEFGGVNSMSSRMNPIHQTSRS